MFGKILSDVLNSVLGVLPEVFRIVWPIVFFVLFVRVAFWLRKKYLKGIGGR